ncbi:MAG TPA: NUDIX hydrolase [Candidatus Polarisedimenticolia bacterium]|nr:NUDIX hydrolase [Candidatus Polarisedimenticolia bacterium]
MSPVDLFHDDGSVPYRFCPRCGGGLESRVVFSHDPPRLVCGACGFVFYLDPKVAAGAICRMDGGVVLLRRGIEPGYGLWVYPGGYVDRGESLEEAAVREAREEVGLEIRLTGLVNAYSYPGRPVIVVVFAADVIGGALTRGEEALDAQVFPPGDIPWGDLAFRSTTDALKEFFGGAARRFQPEPR